VSELSLNLLDSTDSKLLEIKNTNKQTVYFAPSRNPQWPKSGDKITKKHYSRQQKTKQKRTSQHRNRYHAIMQKKVKRLMSVGFEPTPMKTTALTLRLRPLGHDILVEACIKQVL
jgi:hypothetical protein